MENQEPVKKPFDSASASAEPARPAGGASTDASAMADTSADKQGKSLRIGKLMVDRNLCIGAASCIAVAPSTFELDPENKAVLRRKQPPPSSDMTAREDLADQTIDDETLLLAAKSCPTQAIIVYDEEGNQIYP